MENQHLLEGKRVVITGGGRGLGRDIVRGMVEAGAKVAILGRDTSKLQETVSELGPNVLSCPTDIQSPESVRDAFGQIGATFESIDTLVNNAGIFPIYKVEEATDAELKATIDTNLMGPLYCIREAIPMLRAAGGGNIINISSESVRHPFPFLTVYAASKSALEVLSAGLRDELKPDKIRVTALRLGRVQKQATESSWEPALAERFLSAAEASGHLNFSGVGMNPETISAAIVNVAALPADANIDLLELRSI